MSKLLPEKLNNLLKKGVVLSLLGNGVSTFLSLLTFTLLARWLTPADMGAYVYLYSIFTLFDTVRTGLLFNALLQKGAAATSESEYRRWEGAVWQINWLFSALVTVVAALVLAVGQSFFHIDLITALWMVGGVFVSVPGNIAGWMLMARARFVPMQLQKLLFPVWMLGVLAAIHFTTGLTLHGLLLANLTSTAFVSVWSCAARWCLPMTVTEGTASERRHLLNYGKYSIGSLLGSNLLRNSDIYLLRYFVGNEAVALYSVPQRLIQIIEMPLRSVVSAAIPAIVRTFHHEPPNALSRLVAREIGVLTALLIPVSIGGILLADYLVVWLAGEQYKDAAWLVRIFMVYSLLMPLDRYLGVTLDAIGQPKANLFKMIGMLLVNIVGDCLALWLFKTPEAVAIITILTFGSGIMIGIHFARLHKVVLTIPDMIFEGTIALRRLANRSGLGKKIPGSSQEKELVNE